MIVFFVSILEMEIYLSFGGAVDDCCNAFRHFFCYCYGMNFLMTTRARLLK